MAICDGLGLAILDIQWQPNVPRGKEVLAVATAEAYTEFLTLNHEPDGKIVGLQYACYLAYVGDDTDPLTLSLAWHPHRHDVLALTFSNGEAQINETRGVFTEENHNISSSAVHRHELEAWTAVFSTDGTGLFSGGDDCVLQYSEFINTDEGFRTVQDWKDRRIHQAGVTAILPWKDVLVITGSYDDHIRLLSAPAAGRREVLAEMDLGGGVWRLKFMGPSDPGGVSNAGVER